MNEKVKNIYDKINPTNEYLKDPTIKTLVAISFYELEEETEKEFDYNDTLDKITAETLVNFVKALKLRFFDSFESIMSDYKEHKEHQKFIYTFKLLIKDAEEGLISTHDIPVLKKLPTYIEFNGDDKSVEIFINKISFGDFKTNDLDKFIYNYFTKIAHYNNFDTSLIKERLNEINLKNNFKYMRTYYTYDLEYIFNIEQNLIKQTCKELGLTYKQLGEAIGYSESAVNNSSRGEVSKAMQKVIELYVENLKLKKDIENSNKIKVTLKEWLK